MINNTNTILNCFVEHDNDSRMVYRVNHVTGALTMIDCVIISKRKARMLGMHIPGPRFHEDISQGSQENASNSQSQSKDKE